MHTAAVVTVSDRCAAGVREDKSGQLLKDMLEAAGFTVVHTCIIPDERPLIGQTLTDLCDRLQVNLVATTGGTGFAPRDVTPEATRDVLERHVPGIGEAMRAASLKVTPKAILSRGISGIRGRSLIVNLPGSPKAVKENLEAVLPAIPHGLDILLEQDGDCGEKPHLHHHGHKHDPMHK